ncbi:MAG: [protein-PII] uridylyltransferase [Xanthomonadales bacterium]|nr:[protein-PII] uridylyltransferase [Xanthomonadales bacterium]
MKIRLRGPLTQPAAAEGCVDTAALARHTGEPSNAELIRILKTALARADQCLTEKFHNNEDVNQLVKARAWVVDQLVLFAWNSLIPAGENTSLVAVGGFGRGELHPHSDVDLLILLDESEPGEELRAAIEAFVTLLWDAGFYLGHSVRSVEACVSEAKKDIATATSLMESRLLSGKRSMLEEMLDATTVDQVWSAAEFFDAKFVEQVNRHEQYHGTAYNLEPNIKEGPGGLRDIQMIGWVAKRHFSTQSLHTLVARGFLTESELQDLKDGRTFLWEIRFALHLLAGRGEDRLLFEFQRKIADHFFIGDSSDPSDEGQSNIVVEQFMQRYYRTVMRLERLNEMLLQLFREELLLNKSVSSKDLGGDFQVTRGFLEVSDQELFERKPVAMMELFVLLAKNEEILGVRASTIRLIRDNLHRIDEEFRADPQARQYFFELFCQPSGVYTQLQRMNRYGVLAAFIPVFGNIVGRMQFDLFHVYTVDQHILFVVRNLRRFAYGKYRTEFAHAAYIYRQIDHTELLYMAALFHDIAKGREGDHSTLGAQDALEFCRQMPMSEEHGELVAWLVEQHLLMSQTAQRRDISDPETIKAFCAIVTSQTRLDYLYLMTIADIAATSSKLWNSWKDSLLWELYSIASIALEEGTENIFDRNHRINESRENVRVLLQQKGIEPQAIESLWDSIPQSVFLSFSTDQLEWTAATVLKADPGDTVLVAIREVEERGVSELLVNSPDYDGQFSAVTTVIDEIGLDVLSARVGATNSEKSFDLFQLMDRHAQPLNHIDSERLKLRLLEVLEDSSVPEPVVRRLPRRLRPFKSTAKIRFSAAHGGDKTLMDLACSDRPGLLSNISAAMVTCGVRIHDARIATMGDRVEDAFILSDREDAPLNRKMRTQLLETLNETLSQDWSGDEN